MPLRSNDKPLGCNSRESQMDRVDMRIPEFSPEDPEVWFLIMESNFKTAGIVVDSTKYAYVVSALDSHYIEEVRDIIATPPAEHVYDFIKSEVIKCLSPPQEHKTRQLLEHEEIGDRKPSQFLRRLRNFAGNMVGDELLRSIWLSRLPTSLQPHLVTRTNDCLDQLAYAADLIMDSSRNTSLWIAKTVRPSSIHNAEQVKDRMTVLEARMRSLEAISESGRSNLNAKRRTRSHSRLQSRPSGTVIPRRVGLCWYHWRFGSETRRCEPRCSARQPAENATAHR